MQLITKKQMLQKKLDKQQAEKAVNNTAIQNRFQKTEDEKALLKELKKQHKATGNNQPMVKITIN